MKPSIQPSPFQLRITRRVMQGWTHPRTPHLPKISANLLSLRCSGADYPHSFGKRKSCGWLPRFLHFAGPQLPRPSPPFLPPLLRPTARKRHFAANVGFAHFSISALRTRFLTGADVSLLPACLLSPISAVWGWALSIDIPRGCRSSAEEGGGWAAEVVG